MFNSNLQRYYLIIVKLCIVLMVGNHSYANQEKASEAIKVRANNKINAENYKGAIEDFNEALKLTTNDYEIYLGRAIAKQFLNDNKGSLLDLDKAIKLEPKSGQAYYLKGLALRNLNNNTVSIQQFSKALQVSQLDYGLNIKAYSGRAGAKSAIGDHNGALKDYTQVLKLDSSRGLTYYLRGVTRLHLKDREGALLDFSKAGELGFSDAYEIIEKMNQ